MPVPMSLQDEGWSPERPNMWLEGWAFYPLDLQREERGWRQSSSRGQSVTTGNEAQAKLWTPSQWAFLAGEHSMCWEGDAPDSGSVSERSQTLPYGTRAPKHKAML